MGLKKVDVLGDLRQADGSVAKVKVSEQIVDDESGAVVAKLVDVQEWRNGQLVKVGEKFVTPVVRDKDGDVISGGDDYRVE